MKDQATNSSQLDRLKPEEIRSRNKALLLEGLRTIGATRSTVTYFGAGDEGHATNVHVANADRDIENLSVSIRQIVTKCESDDGKLQMRQMEVEQLLEDALLDFSIDAVEAHHGNWQDGDGSSGEVVFDTETGTVRVEHNAYLTESNYTETEL